MINKKGIFDFFGDGFFRIRLNKSPPKTIHDASDISIRLDEEKTALDSVGKFWASPDRWACEPGYKLFLQAYHVLPLKTGNPAKKMKFYNDDLNEGQVRVIKQALDNEGGLFSIQGPPGTGKTKVVGEIVAQLIKRKKKVLVMAPSHKSVDNVAERVHCLLSSTKDPSALGFVESNKPYAAQMQMAAHKDYPELEELSKEATQCWEHNKRRVDMAMEQRTEIWDEMIAGSQVLYATLNSAVIRSLKYRKFVPDVVIIDEAGQAAEYLAWIGIMKAPRAIVVGDQWQLGPTVMSQENGLEEPSVMQYLEEEFGSKLQQRLTRQYRSNEKIMRWSNDSFYDGKLEADESVKDQELNEILQKPLKENAEPLVFIDTKNTGARCREVHAGPSYRNFGEAEIVVGHVRKLLKAGLPAHNIGVITPYMAQATHIKKSLNDIDGLVVSTVDAFQGQEREVIVMSLVRSERLGFLTNLQRMNVSITRAKRQFLLVANSEVLKDNSVLEALHCELKASGHVVKLAKDPTCIGLRL